MNGTVITGAALYIFRELIRENVADEVSLVASRSLGDESLKVRAHALSMALLEDLLNDASMQEQAGNGTKYSLITVASSFRCYPGE